MFLYSHVPITKSATNKAEPKYNIWKSLHVKSWKQIMFASLDKLKWPLSNFLLF